MKTIFQKIYEENTWGGVSRSGPGSDPEATEEIIRQLKNFIHARSITTIVDAPCGVFDWQSNFLPAWSLYYGVDIVPEIQFKNLRRERFMPKHNFILADVVNDNLPTGDLVICRDLMIHLPVLDCLKLLKNLTSIGYKYYALTNFPEVHGNNEVEAGGFTSRNLMDIPFEIGLPYQILPETHIKGWPKKELAVYTHAQMADRFVKGTI